MPPLTFHDLTIGDLVAFQIGTREGCSTINQHKWGVIKVLHLQTLNPNTPKQAHYMTVSILAGVTDAAPTPWQVRFRKVLVEQRFKGKPGDFFWKGPFIFSTDITAGVTLPSTTIIGRETIRRLAELRILPKLRRSPFPIGVTSGHISNIALNLDHEHRAIHDHANWQAEVDLAREKSRQARLAAEARQQTRLQGLTLAALLAETPLLAWDQRPELVPPHTTATLRARIQTVLQDLAALGPKPPRPAARKILSAFVLWLNEADTIGNIFETDEREDLMALLEEICWAVKQKPLIPELDNLRTW